MFRDSFGTHRYILQLLNDFPCRGNLSLLDKLEHAGGKGRPKKLYPSSILFFCGFFTGCLNTEECLVQRKGFIKVFGLCGVAWDLVPFRASLKLRSRAIRLLSSP